MSNTPSVAIHAVAIIVSLAISPAMPFAQTVTTFLTDAAQGGEAEIILAQEAQKKGVDATVKALAERLEKDHKVANSELRAIIAKKQLVVPGGMPPAALALNKKLAGLQGADFDHEYASAMVAHHTNAIQLFQTAVKSPDSDIRGFAEKTLPTLREHLKMAQDAQKTVDSILRSPSAGAPAKPQSSGTAPTSPGGMKAARPPGQP